LAKDRLKTLNESAPTKRGKALIAVEKLGIDLDVYAVNILTAKGL